MKKVNKIDQEKMTDLADKTGLTYDGGPDYNDDRLFFDDERIDVFAHLMTEKEYKQMCKEINKAQIKRKHYTVYAWNDIGGYDYWREEGESGGGANYINITVAVINPDKADPEKIKADVEELFYSLDHWHNLDEYLNELHMKRYHGE